MFHGDDGFRQYELLNKTLMNNPVYIPADIDPSSLSGVDFILEMAARYPDELIIVCPRSVDESGKSDP